MNDKKITYYLRFNKHNKNNEINEKKDNCKTYI